MANTKVDKADLYLQSPPVRAAIDFISMSYDFQIDSIVTYLLDDIVTIDLAADILVSDFAMERAKAQDLIDRISEYIVEPYHVFAIDDNEITEADRIEKNRLQNPEVEIDKAIKPKEINWRSFIAADNLLKFKKELISSTGNDINKIKNYLWSSLGLKNSDEVVVILNYLAEKNLLNQIWFEDTRFKGILRNSLLKQYSDKQVATWLSNSDMSAGLFSYALHLLLVEKLEINKSDAAMIAIVLVDSMPIKQKAKYITVAYVDAGDNSFNWAELSDSGDNLVIVD